jgi:hypothetical protein
MTKQDLEYHERIIEKYYIFIKLKPYMSEPIYESTEQWIYSEYLNSLTKLRKIKIKQILNN